MSPKDLFESHLKLIEKAARHAARRHRLSVQDAEDFISRVNLKLIDDDYRVIRMHKGKSSLRTYLISVVHREVLDFQDYLWGSWRPCAEAKALGPDAVKLDELLYREHYTRDQACEILRTNYKVKLSKKEIYELADLLPSRTQRRMEDEEVLQGVSTPDPSPEEELLIAEKQARFAKALEALGRILNGLADEDRVLLQMSSTFQVSKIAKILRLKQKPLYPRLRKLSQQVRQALEAEGIDAEDVKGSLPPEEEA